MTNFVRHRLAHHHHVDRFNQPIVLFVTVCAIERKQIYNNDQAHQAMLAAWKSAIQWNVAEYMIMPDHIHLFCIPGVQQPEAIRKWARYWKRLAGKFNPSLKATWQDDIWDRQFRTREKLEEKRNYIRMNPVRAGLCNTPNEWPYHQILREIIW